jgi:hypothetical protein
MQAKDPPRAPWRIIAGVLVLIVIAAAFSVARGHAATAAGCEGGGFTVLGLSGDQTTSVPAANVPATFLVKGKYVEFTVVADSFGITDYTFTGAPNALDMTGGQKTVVFASKTPNHRGLTLTGPVSVESVGESITLSRSGPGLSMKLQANDCAKGGLFQMEPQRADGTATRITHTLADGVFYFDNPNFRAREGDVVPYKDTTVKVAARINFANDVSANFVGRDSPQVATRVLQGCVNTVPAPRNPDGTPNPTGTATVDHCGGQSVWDVASGGRMGGVFGDDAVEVAPPSKACTHQCQAQDRVRGQAVVLGFPFKVPNESRLQPRFPG